MSAPLRELLRIRTEQDWLEFLLRALSGQGWDLTDAHSGAVGRTLVQIDARALADLSLYIPEIAQSGFLQFAEGGWLDLIAASQYGLTRHPAVSTEGHVMFTAAEGFGPYRLRVPTWIQTPGRVLYTTVAEVNVPRGTTVEADVRAERPGAKYNVGPNSLTALLTPLPGLSVTNLEDWITRAGADQESDERLRTRARLAWPALGSGATRDAYVSWALDASPSVAKVGVLDMDPRGPGTVDVILAGEGGAVGADVVAEVNEVIQRKRPLTSNVEVRSAIPRGIALEGTVSYQAAFGDDAYWESASRLQAYQRDLPVGAVVRRAAIFQIYMSPVGDTPLRGIVNLVLDSPPADVPLGDEEVAVFGDYFTWVAV